MKPFNQKKVFIANLFTPVWKLIGLFFKRSPIYKVPPDNILIMDVHLIGDMIMLTPLIAALHEKYPSARISVIAGPWAKTVFNNFSEINTYYLIEVPWVKYDRQLFRWWNVLKMVRTLRKSTWEMAIDVRGDIRHTLFLRLSGVKNLVSYSFFGADKLIDHIVPNDEALVHLTDYNRRICEYLNAWPSGIRYQPFLRVSADEMKTVDSFPAYIGLHFGASLPMKRPPVERLQKWIDEIMQRYPGSIMVVFRLSEAPDISDFIYQYISENSAEGKVMFWEGNLRDFIIVLTRCRHLFCLDSGPGHIASALGIQTTAIFGPTVPGKSYPIGIKTNIVEGKKLDCQQTCDQRKCTNMTDRACMPETILAERRSE